MWYCFTQCVVEGNLVAAEIAILNDTPAGSEARLSTFGLSTELFHIALRSGLTRAANRTALALASSPGTDIYHDTMEQLALALAEDGWKLVLVGRQPRLLHPGRLISFTLASGENVADPDPRRRPRTRRKGKATRESLELPHQRDALFEDLQSVVTAAAQSAPLWLLVHERTDRGLKLEFSRPAGMTDGGIVKDWADRIPLAFLDLDGDLTVFEDVAASDIEVPVEPLER